MRREFFFIHRSLRKRSFLSSCWNVFRIGCEDDYSVDVFDFICLYMKIVYLYQQQAKQHLTEFSVAEQIVYFM